MMVYNFDKYPVGIKQYRDGTMDKQSKIVENIPYMIKYMKKGIAKQYKSKPYTYFNSVYSEYIACKIGKKIGLNIQDVIIGYGTMQNEFKPSVGCKDFCKEGEMFINFTQVLNIVEYDNKIKYNKNDFYDMLNIIMTQKFIETNELKKHFLDMFVFDAFIGNFDRNLDNFGIIKEYGNDIYRITPIYDCGSSMHPKTTRNRINMYNIQYDLNDEIALIDNIKKITSFFTINNKKINYYDFLVEREFNQDKDIAEAILRVAPKLVEIQENGYIEKLVDSLSELMGEDRAKVLKIELEYKAQHMFKEMIRIANKVLEKEKEQTSSWIKKEIDDDWER